jgi:copper chaperone CopZ
MTTAMYSVDGVICESCVAAVVENVHSLSGVSVVAMDLVSGGASPMIVTSGTKLGADAVRHAVEHVGFGVVPSVGPELSDPRNKPAAQDVDAYPDREPMSSMGGVTS